MKPTFLTKAQLGRLTHGTYNPRFQACIRLPTGKIILAHTGERTHADIRQRLSLPTAGEDGYTMRVSA